MDLVRLSGLPGVSFEAPEVEEGMEPPKPAGEIGGRSIFLDPALRKELIGNPTQQFNEAQNRRVWERLNRMNPDDYPEYQPGYDYMDEEARQIAQRRDEEAFEEEVQMLMETYGMDRRDAVAQARFGQTPRERELSMRALEERVRNAESRNEEGARRAQQAALEERVFGNAREATANIVEAAYIAAQEGREVGDPDDTLNELVDGLSTQFPQLEREEIVNIVRSAALSKLEELQGADFLPNEEEDALSRYDIDLGGR